MSPADPALGGCHAPVADTGVGRKGLRRMAVETAWLPRGHGRTATGSTLACRKREPGELRSGILEVAVALRSVLDKSRSLTHDMRDAGRKRASTRREANS